MEVSWSEFFLRSYSKTSNYYRIPFLKGSARQTETRELYNTHQMLLAFEGNVYPDTKPINLNYCNLPTKFSRQVMKNS